MATFSEMTGGEEWLQKIIDLFGPAVLEEKPEEKLETMVESKFIGPPEDNYPTAEENVLFSSIS